MNVNRTLFTWIAVLAGLFLLQNAFQFGGFTGWFARGQFDANHTVLPKQNGTTVVPSHETVLLNRGGQTFEVPADANSGFAKIIVQPAPVQTQVIQAPAPPPVPHYQPAPPQHRPIPPPCGTPQTPCGPDDGFQPIVPR